MPVNSGQGTKEMLSYIEKINTLADSTIPLENETVNNF